MPMVKVFNENSFDHKEYFKGDLISIPAGKFVVMEEDEAHMFKGQFFQMQKNADGQQLPSSFKKIRVEELPRDVAFRTNKLVCNRCAYQTNLDEDLSAHLKAEHADEQFTDPELEIEIKRKRGRPASA